MRDRNYGMSGPNFNNAAPKWYLWFKNSTGDLKIGCCFYKKVRENNANAMKLTELKTHTEAEEPLRHDLLSDDLNMLASCLNEHPGNFAAKVMTAFLPIMGRNAQAT